MSRRSAPRREVMSVERVGRHGRVAHRHFLACGHFQDRKRVAPTSVIGCLKCESPDWSVGDEVDFRLLQVRLADLLGAATSDVDMNVRAVGERFQLQGVTVSFTPEAVERLLKRKR